MAQISTVFTTWLDRNSPSPGLRQFLFSDTPKKLLEGKGNLLAHPFRSVKCVTWYGFVNGLGLRLI